MFTDVFDGCVKHGPVAAPLGGEAMALAKHQFVRNDATLSGPRGLFSATTLCSLSSWLMKTTGQGIAHGCTLSSHVVSSAQSQHSVPMERLFFARHLSQARARRPRQAETLESNRPVEESDALRVFAAHPGSGSLEEARLALRVRGVITSLEPLRLHVHSEPTCLLSFESPNSWHHMAGKLTFEDFVREAARHGIMRSDINRELNRLLARTFLGWKRFNGDLLANCRVDRSCSQRGLVFEADVGISQGGRAHLFGMRPACASLDDKDDAPPGSRRDSENTDHRSPQSTSRAAVEILSLSRLVDPEKWEGRVAQLVRMAQFEGKGLSLVSDALVHQIVLGIKEWYLGAILGTTTAYPQPISDLRDRWTDPLASAADVEFGRLFREALEHFKRALPSETMSADRKVWASVLPPLPDL